MQPKATVSKQCWIDDIWTIGGTCGRVMTIMVVALRAVTNDKNVIQWCSVDSLTRHGCTVTTTII